MPFSNIKSLEIKEKMKYYDKLFNQKKSSINGNEYYINQMLFPNYNNKF